MQNMYVIYCMYMDTLSFKTLESVRFKKKIIKKVNTVIQRGHIQLIKAASKDICSVIKYIYSAFTVESIQPPFNLFFMLQPDTTII